MKFAICYNKFLENSQTILEKLTTLLKENNADFKILDVDNLANGFDFAFVIGGDGTILKAARFYSEFETPVFGINLGHLGFLSQTLPDNLPNSIRQILNNDYKIEKRMMLSAGDQVALNDFVIKGSTSGRTSQFALEINGKFVCEYLADGVIISTPTGSTAYAMAAGGPVLTPGLEAITIIPICPHTFSARPIVVCANDKIRILPVKNNKYTIFADGQIAFELEKELIIQKSSHMANLALLNDNDFYEVIRNKLKWGITPAKS